MNESRHTVWFSPQPGQRGLRLSTGLLFGMWALTGTVAVVGWTNSSQRFLRAYMVSFACLVTLGLGALFFVLLHHLVHARWSVRACMRMEQLAGLLRLAPLLFLPIALKARDLYPWFHADPAELLRHPAKAAYWTMPFFLGRSALYLGTWWGLATWFRHPPDGFARMRAERQRRRLSGPAMIALGLTTIFAAFDWWMGLERRFHSGIFGVYVFVGAVVAGLALLAIVTACSDFRGSQFSPSAVEERHDIGKLLFGFVAFWGYIAFCQYLIIWYANIPMEMEFYLHRWSRPWRATTTLLVMLHFVVPFIVLLSRNTKRSAFDLVAVSVIVLAGHVLDVIWLVTPALRPSGPKLGIAELGAASIALSVTVSFARRAASVSLGRYEGTSDLPHPAVPLPRAEPRPIPFGAHIALLGPVRNPTPHISQNSGWRLAAVSLGVATLALLGGSATASSFGSRLQQEVARKHSESVKRAVAAQVVKGLDEYRWIDKKSGTLQIPLEIAKTLVLSDYASRPAKAARVPRGPSAAKVEEAVPVP